MTVQDWLLTALSGLSVSLLLWVWTLDTRMRYVEAQARLRSRLR